MSAAERITRTLTGRHVLLGLVIFFGVMFFANGLLVYYALSTFSGGDRPNPYRSGLDYNQTLAEAERQAELGWETRADYDRKARRLTLQFTDANAAPVSGLSITGTLMRPVESRDDRAVAFREWSEGVYVSDVELDPGNWVLSAESSNREGGPTVYRLKKRLMVTEGS